MNNGGTITIDGTSKLVVGSGGVAGQGYTQFANGTLGEMIFSANNFGVINVTGAANLAGTLNIMLQGSYDPVNGTMIKFLNFTPGQLNGDFTSILNQTFNGGTQMWMLDANNALGFYELIAQAVSGGTDYWLGGTGNWNGGQWSTGNPPIPTDDVVIYSGVADDLVTMNFGSTTIASLTLGGAPTASPPSLRTAALNRPSPLVTT